MKLLIKNTILAIISLSLISTVLAKDYSRDIQMKDKHTYNLILEKTVGKHNTNANRKSMIVAEGDVITYKLFYKNMLSSTATPLGTKIYDDYDEKKLKILWLPNKPKACIDNGDKIVCNAYDLSSTQGHNEHTFFYTARVKVGATGTILGTAEIKPNRDKDINHSDDTSSVLLRVTTKPVNGICGDGAKTYLSNYTDYQAGTLFCKKGTAVPIAPSFPKRGQKISWICKGSNRGKNSHCSAKKN